MHKPTCMCIHDVTSCPVMCAVLCHSVCWSREHRAVWVDEHVHGRRWAQHRNASSIHCQNYGRVSWCWLLDILPTINALYHISSGHWFLIQVLYFELLNKVKLGICTWLNIQGVGQNILGPITSLINAGLALYDFIIWNTTCNVFFQVKVFQIVILCNVSVGYFSAAWHHNPKDLTLNIHCHENLRCHNSVVFHYVDMDLLQIISFEKEIFSLCSNIVLFRQRILWSYFKTWFCRTETQWWHVVLGSVILAIQQAVCSTLNHGTFLSLNS